MVTSALQQPSNTCVLCWPVVLGGNFIFFLNPGVGLVPCCLWLPSSDPTAAGCRDSTPTLRLRSHSKLENEFVSTPLICADLILACQDSQCVPD